MAEVGPLNTLTLPDDACRIGAIECTVLVADCSLVEDDYKTKNLQHVIHMPRNIINASSTNTRDTTHSSQVLDY
jgi:hypothetical protein